MPKTTLLSFLVALAAGLICAVLVSRIMTPPFAAVEQVLTPGDTEITVMVYPGDQVAGVLEPGQLVDVVAVVDSDHADTRPFEERQLKPVAEKVQVAAIEAPKQMASAPAGALVSQVKLSVTKDQADALRPHQDKADLRFFVRQRPEKK